jgi:multimeric flavodoxin WrbA
MQILAIFGSPRRGGNTDRLLETFVEGAEETGAVCRRLVVRDQGIGPCDGCQACDADGICVLRDGMQPVYEWIDEADLVVLASPIYFYGITAQAKALVDRSQALWARKHRLGIRSSGPKFGFLISTGGSKGRRLFECAELTMKYFSDAIDAHYVGSLTFRSIDRLGDIERHPQYLDEARDSGRRLAADLSARLEGEQTT